MFQEVASAAAILVLAFAFVRYVRARTSSRRPIDAGSVSESWLVEQRAASDDRSRS
jgi:hypothetical protein